MVEPDGACGREEMKVSGPLRANNSEPLREAAIAGIGLILMPTWLIGGDLGQVSSTDDRLSVDPR